MIINLGLDLLAILIVSLINFVYIYLTSFRKNIQKISSKQSTQENLSIIKVPIEQGLIIPDWQTAKFELKESEVFFIFEKDTNIGVASCCLPTNYISEISYIGHPEAPGLWFLRIVINETETKPTPFTEATKNLPVFTIQKPMVFLIEPSLPTGKLIRKFLLRETVEL